MKVNNLNWNWISQEEGIKQAGRSFKIFRMTVYEKFGEYRLKIEYLFKPQNTTYHELQSKDMESAILEAETIAMKELLNIRNWCNDIINEIGYMGIKMKFYEFNSPDFGYYALIGAESEEVAIKYYAESIADIEDEDSYPVEIEIHEARKKLLDICKDDNENIQAVEQFTEHSISDEPYLVLVDGSLL